MLVGNAVALGPELLPGEKTLVVALISKVVVVFVESE